MTSCHLFRNFVAAFVLFGLLVTNCDAQYDLDFSDKTLELAIAWYTGETGQVDDDLARQLLESIQPSGDTLAVMWLARVYSTGRMTYSADKNRAIDIANSVLPELEQLADQGNLEAIFLMGTVWAEGLGKEVDAVEAFSWYRKAADQGHVLAAHNLGNSYAAGRGVEKDPIAAVRWWQFAAEKGDAIPQLRLGQYYEQGIGVAKDLDLARMWFEDAAGRGNADAKQALERLEYFESR